MTGSVSNRSLKRKGNTVVLKQVVEDTEMNAKQLIEQLATVKAQQDQSSQARMRIEQQTEQLNNDEAGLSDKRKLLEKEIEWATAQQQSVFQAVFDEIKDEVSAAINKNYQYDKGLTQKENDIQKFHQYRAMIVRNPKMQERVAEIVWREKIFGPDAIIGLYENNPWPLDTEVEAPSPVAGVAFRRAD